MKLISSSILGLCFGTTFIVPVKAQITIDGTTRFETPRIIQPRIRTGADNWFSGENTSLDIGGSFYGNACSAESGKTRRIKNYNKAQQ
ncbi:MAG: hypothetical protein QNJ70_28555 [Xenococcaceae cyanobacterium MO_207.B15]|nr:hypothetical protein [Xenococcaceae cyanobacterium MO_207.B15]